MSTNLNQLPVIDPEKWRYEDHRNIFKTWSLEFHLLIYTQKVNKKSNGWVLLYDQVERQASTSYPGLTTAAKREQHLDGQTTLLGYLARVWHPLLPELIQQHTLSKYHDIALQVNGEPYPVGTMLLSAIDNYCNPQDHKTLDANKHQFRLDIRTFTGLARNNDTSIRKFQDKLAQMATTWLELSSDVTFKNQEEELIRLAKGAITTFTLQATESQKKMLWDKFVAEVEIDELFIADHTLTEYLAQLSRYALSAYKDLKRAGLTDENCSNAKSAVALYTADKLKGDIGMCDFCGPNSRHATDRCYKLQAINAKVDKLKHEKQIAGPSSQGQEFRLSRRQQSRKQPYPAQGARGSHQGQGARGGHQGQGTRDDYHEPRARGSFQGKRDNRRGAYGGNKGKWNGRRDQQGQQDSQRYNHNQGGRDHQVPPRYANPVANFTRELADSSVLRAAGSHNSVPANEVHFAFQAHAVEETTNSHVAPKHRTIKQHTTLHLHRKKKKYTTQHHLRQQQRPKWSRLEKPESTDLLSINSHNFSDNDDISEEETEHHSNWTFPADMPALDRQIWSDKHTEQGKPRRTEPKFNLQRLKRRKLKDDPTDQELFELSNLPGRDKSNPTLELQIKGLSRYSPTYNDDDLEMKRIARLSKPDAQESREAKQRYAQKKRKYKKMIANFADRMQELITITLPFADTEWTASEITYSLPSNIQFFNLRGGFFHGHRARALLFVGDESGDNLNNHEDPDMTEVRLTVTSVINSDDGYAEQAKIGWRMYFDWRHYLDPPDNMEHRGINKIEIRDIQADNMAWTNNVFVLPLDFRIESDHCQRHWQYYNDCTFVLQQANKGIISSGLAYASIMGGRPDEVFNLYNNHIVTGPFHYTFDNTLYRPLVNGLPTTINQIAFADLEGTNGDSSAIIDLMSEHMLLTFCKLTLAHTGSIFLDSQVHMTRTSPVEQHRRALEEEQRDTGGEEHSNLNRDVSLQLVTPYTGISIDVNQDLVTGNIFEKDLGRSDDSRAPVTLLAPSEIIDRLTDNWRFSVPTALLPTKDNMNIDIGKNSAAFDVDKEYEDLIIQLGSLVLDDEAHNVFCATNAPVGFSADTLTRFNSMVAQSNDVSCINEPATTSVVSAYFLSPVSPAPVCHMVLTDTKQLSTYSHSAIIDSGTNMHILQHSLFVTDTYEKHSSVASFSGTSSRSTLKGSLSCTVTTDKKQLLHLYNTDSALIVPDTIRNLLSVHQLQKAGHTVVLGHKAGIHIDSQNAHFVPFTVCPTTGLWLLNLLPPPTATNRVYKVPTHLLTANAETTDIENTDTRITDHQRLGHPSFKRMRDLDIDGVTIIPAGKRMKPISCPVCIASKMRKPSRPSASTDMTCIEPWTDIYTDLSGKVRTQSITGSKYFVVFIDTFTGAKHVDFLNSKNHFIHAYNRLVAYLGHHPKVLRSDQGTEIKNAQMTKILENNHTNHIVCAKDEHYSIGVAENAVGVLRSTAKAMLLQANVPKKFWPFAISHACYLSNIVYPSRSDKTITIFEALFNKKADVRRIPPFGSFTCIYQNRRALKDQSFDLTSTQGIFIGIARHNKVLGYCITDGVTVSVTRNSIAFDPHLFPFTLRPNAAAPNWQTFHDLNQPAASGARAPSNIQGHPALMSPPLPQDENVSDKSDFDPNFDNMSIDTDNPEDSPSSTSEDEEEAPPTPAATRPTRASAMKANQQLLTHHKPRAPRRHTLSDTKWHTDLNHKLERSSFVGCKVQKIFPPHGIFKGNIESYYHTTDTYLIKYEDGDVEVVTYGDMKTLVPGTPEHQATVANCTALHVAFTTAIDAASHLPDLQRKEPLTYKQARAAPDAKEWIAACDLEMKKLRDLQCWEVQPKTNLPNNTHIMGSRWTFKYKIDEHGHVTRHRSRFVAKGFTQIKDVTFFENFAPVASYVTIRTLFALTALPMFIVLQYDVSVAFIESILDDNAPPIYCECADGYEDKSKYCYLLRRHLYGMRDSPRGYAKLFESICKSFNLTQLKTDECVYIKIVNNQKDQEDMHAHPLHTHLSRLHEMKPDVSSNNRIYSDCAYPISILIVCSYVDDNLFFTNSNILAKEFEAHCNTRLKMTSEGPVNWYLSVKYDRCPLTGAVSANQELYINKILQRWGMSTCHPLPTPFPAKADDVITALAEPILNPDPKIIKEFQELCGALLYVQVHTVPEISWTLSLLTKYMTKAGPIHLATAKKILRYLQGRKSIPITWCAQACREPHLPGHIYGYADASFADVKPERTSSMGYVFIINNAAVSWRSTRSPIVVLNACEAEVVSLSSACQEAVYLRKLCNELGFIQTSPTTMYEDCESAVALSKENRFRNRSKHISLRWAYVTERQSPHVADIHVVSVSRRIMLADIFASPRPAASFLPFRNSILGLASASCTMPPKGAF
jgi:hypothetical protein